MFQFTGFASSYLWIQYGMTLHTTLSVLFLYQKENAPFLGRKGALCFLANLSNLARRDWLLALRAESVL